MKIGFLADAVYAHVAGRPCLFCGAERQQWLLGRALAAAGWQVVFGVQDGLDLNERRHLDGLEFVGIGRGRSLAAWRRFLFQERPDWCYWRGAYHLLGPGVALARAAGVRTVFATAFDSDVHPRKALTIRRSWWPLYAWGLRRADRILVQHGGQLAGVPSRWRSKAGVVYSIAGSPPVMRPHAEREPVVAWVGMLRAPKRPDLLIDIARRSPATRFVVCGGPSSHRLPEGYGERIERALRSVPNVQHLGYVAPERAEEIIGAASLLLSTSDEEGFPNTFLQAWSAGTPVVSLTIDPDDAMRRGGFGVVPGGIDGAVPAMQALLESSGERQKMGLLARRHVETVHSEDAVVRAFQAILQSYGSAAGALHPSASPVE